MVRSEWLVGPKNDFHVSGLSRFSLCREYIDSYPGYFKKINYYVFTSQSKLIYYADSESGLSLPNYVINFGVFGDFSQFLVLIKNLFLTCFSLLENNYYIKYRESLYSK